MLFFSGKNSPWRVFLRLGDVATGKNLWHFWCINPVSARVAHVSVFRGLLCYRVVTLLLRLGFLRLEKISVKNNLVCV